MVTNEIVLQAVRDLHGDVKVALDRTATHSLDIANLRTALTAHSEAIAAAKGASRANGAVMGIIGGGVMSFLAHLLLGRP